MSDDDKSQKVNIGFAGGPVLSARVTNSNLKTLRDARATELRFDTLRMTWKRLKRKPAPLARQLRAILAARAPDARR